MNSWCRNLELLIKSRTSLIWIKTREEERLEKKLKYLCESLNIKRFVYWDCVSGIKGLLENLPSSFNNPLIPLTQSQQTYLLIFNLLHVKSSIFSNLSSSLVLIQISEVLDFTSNSKFLHHEFII